MMLLKLSFIVSVIWVMVFNVVVAAPAGPMTRSQRRKIQESCASSREPNKEVFTIDRQGPKKSVLWQEADQWKDEVPIDFESLLAQVDEEGTSRTGQAMRESSSRVPSPLQITRSPEESFEAHWWRQVQRKGVDSREVDRGVWDPASPHYFKALGSENESSSKRARSDHAD